MTTITAPAPFTAEHLADAQKRNAAHRQQIIEFHREQGDLAADEKSFTHRSYRYTKAGQKVLDKEVRVPILSAPETPEEAWDILGKLTFDLDDAEYDGDETTALYEMAHQIAGYGMNFLFAAGGVAEGSTNYHDLPAESLAAAVSNHEAYKAHVAAKEAREGLALGTVSISKARKLEAAHGAARTDWFSKTFYALDGATGWNAGSLDRLAPGLADALRSVAANARLA